MSLNNMMRFSLFLALIFAGCSLIPTDRTKSESVKSSENIAATHELTIRRALEVGPEMGLRVSRHAGPTPTDISGVTPTVLPHKTATDLPPMRETLEIHSGSSQVAGSKDNSAGTSTVSIPFFVKVIGLGLGIGILTGALLLAWKYAKTTAVGQGLQLADEALARVIQRKRQTAATTTDSGKQAETHAEIAQLESERGRLKL